MNAEVDARSVFSQVRENSGLAYDEFAEGGSSVADGIPLPEDNVIDGSDWVADDSVLVDPDQAVELESSGDDNIEIDAAPKTENGSGICLPAGQNQDGNLEDDALVVEESSPKSLDDEEPGEGYLSDDKGDQLTTLPDENTPPNGSTRETRVEENGHWENSDMASSFVMVGSIEINCKPVLASLPFRNAALKSLKFSAAFENLRLDLQVQSPPECTDHPDACCLQGTKTEAMPENETVADDTRLSCHASDVNEVEAIEVKRVSSSGTLESSTFNVDSEIGFEPFSARSSSYEEATRSSCFSNYQGSLSIGSELNEEEVAAMDENNWDLHFGTYSPTLDATEDEFIGEKIKQDQSLVDQNTPIPVSFPDQIQTSKAACKELSSNLNDAQSMMNKAIESLSINEIGIMINTMVRKMAHETLPLKEEIQLISDIKKLVQLQDRLSLDADDQHLQKELDFTNSDNLEVDELTMAMMKKYGGEKENLNEIRVQFEEANEIQQENYVDLQCLKKPFDEKREYYRKYKNDMEVADDLALRKDWEKLQAHAINQVENLMERWNEDEEYRKDYIRGNTESTVTRLGTSDGRSSEADEEQRVLDSGGAKVPDIKDSTGLDFGDTIEEHKRSEEEEELRKEEEAIGLQEQVKMEEKARAEIVLARKIRKAERAQARAAIRAQKEAEEKEKEKEKKKKRKNKKPAAEEARNEAGIEEEPQPAVAVKTPTDIPETAEESNTTSKKSKKRRPKQNKAKAIIPPPPLRKWGKRKMETWVWMFFTVTIFLGLFLFFLGNNGGYLGKLGMGRLRH